MPDIAVISPVKAQAPASVPARNTARAAAKPAPNYDVIDLSKPPTPEQAERMRSAGILGYGSVSAKKTVSTTTYPDGSSRTVTSLEYTSEFFSAKLSGYASWYAPPQFHEDGSWSLAEYGPSARVSISGYHSVLIAARSGGGQKQLFRSETAAARVEVVLPGQPRPGGELDLSRISQEVLDRIDQCAALLRRSFHAQV